MAFSFPNGAKAVAMSMPASRGFAATTAGSERVVLVSTASPDIEVRVEDLPQPACLGRPGGGEILPLAGIGREVDELHRIILVGTQELHVVEPDGGVRRVAALVGSSVIASTVARCRIV